jgi:hypothetical protein
MSLTAILSPLFTWRISNASNPGWNHDQAKPSSWNEAIISANIDIFQIDYEEAISYFIPLEKLDKIKRTNGQGPAIAVDDNIPVTSRVGIAVCKKKQKIEIWCHYCGKSNYNTASINHESQKA